PVGLLADLDVVGAGAVLYLRLWLDGPQARAKVAYDFDLALGYEQGLKAFQCFEQLCTLCLQYGRRPLVCHQLACACLGADEACFANFIAAATNGECEDALMIASLLVRADLASILTSEAQAFGLALKRMALTAPARTATHSNRSLFH
ncbi:MAG: hypothetical protein ABI459_11985, partial [Deltaproteobacteria bacterium]